MKVRVFIPSGNASAGQLVFSGTDHTFPVLPSVGQALRFTDHREGDFIVMSVGYVQNADAFMPALWLAHSGTELAYSDPTEAVTVSEYRDLNHDVPPESMTTY